MRAVTWQHAPRSNRMPKCPTSRRLRSFRRALWHAACFSTVIMAAATITTDREEIKQWVEERGGFPARVKRTGGADDPGIIRIDFPGFSGEDTLERIDWETWFEAFEENELAFLHQDETEDGQMSHFNKLVSRDSVERAKPRGAKRGGASAGRER